ncbi:hypothetical protein AG1IA_08072 [Rhizoctonia solani AG-1 IA]|uniref:Uncharacterized protein n=1 Tax=Thanatephorus cucumeris (strain AG1-IA) TaxID=983506 RepID=L8WJ05_THACA|nr:hypothetical protein AG1IA_08072 [Rhizoctonia solani AG-1 IA]
MIGHTPAHSEGHSTMYTPDPSTMAHSEDPSPPRMAQDLPLFEVVGSSRNPLKQPVHVTLPPTARTTTRQKSLPTSQAQSPLTSELTSEGQLLALDNFFGPTPQHPRSVDLEKQSAEPLNIFANQKEPETYSRLSGFSVLVSYLWLPAHRQTLGLRRPRLQGPVIQGHRCSARGALGGVDVFFRYICKSPSAGGVLGACTPGSPL